jgi:hypothetical protein
LLSAEGKKTNSSGINERKSLSAVNLLASHWWLSSFFQLDYESVVSSQGARAQPESGPRFLRKLLPDTVQHNVKNVQGWRGGAERGFLAEYPDLVHLLSVGLAEGNDSLVEWTRKVHILAMETLSELHVCLGGSKN